MDFNQEFQNWLTNVSSQFNSLEESNNSLASTIQDQNVTIIKNAKTIADLIKLLSELKKDDDWYGVVSHFYDADVYKSNIQRFIDNSLMLNFNVTRTSPPLKPDGTMVDEDYFFSKVYIPLKKAGIKIMFLLDTEGLSVSDSPDTAYNKGKVLLDGVTKNYGKIFDTIELGNELSVKAIISGKDGRKPEEYDQTKLTSLLSYLKGCYDSIRNYDSKIKIMLNGEWIRYGFIDAALSFGINFDILSWHWYVGSPNQDELFSSYSWTGGAKIEDWLQNRYTTKKIVFNEVGYQTPRTGVFDENNQLLQVPEVITRLRSKGYSVMNYEMFNEFQKTDIVQRNFGLFNADGTPKKIVESLKLIK